MESLFKFLETVPIYVWIICGAALAFLSEIIKRAKKTKLKAKAEE